MKMPVRLIFLIILVVTASISIVGQKKAESDGDINSFAGHWSLVSIKSNVQSNGPGLESYTLEIFVVGSEFKVKRNYSYSGRSFDRAEVYFTNGRGEVNKVPKDNSDGFYTTKTKTKWNDGKIIVKLSVKTELGYTDVTGTYSLSRDGQLLVYQLVRKGGGSRYTKTELIFKRIP